MVTNASAVTVERVDGKREKLCVAGLFVLVGGTPHTQWLAGTIEMDAKGYILTGRDLLRLSHRPSAWRLEREWTLNQGDGTVSRVDTSTRKVTVTIPVGIPGVGSEICYGADSVWAAKFGIPLTRIDTNANKVSRQWVGRGGDAVRFGHGSIWLTDYHRGLLWHIPFKEELQQ